MRLSEYEIQAIKKSVHSLDEKAEIYLYGSRTDKALQGGDIDLLVVSEVLVFKHKIDLLIEIKNAIGEQRLDLSLKSLKELHEDPFWKEVLKKAQKL